MSRVFVGVCMGRGLGGGGEGGGGGDFAARWWYEGCGVMCVCVCVCVFVSSRWEILQPSCFSHL